MAGPLFSKITQMSPTARTDSNISWVGGVPPDPPRDFWPTAGQTTSHFVPASLLSLCTRFFCQSRMDDRGQTVSTSEIVFTSARDGKAMTLYAMLCNKSKLEVNRILSHQTEEDGEKTTPLIIAARNGHDKVVNVLLDNFDVEIEQTGTVKFQGLVSIVEGVTALWCAAAAGQTAVVQTLTKKGANVNHLASFTPVVLACVSGHLDMVKYLIEHNADINIANKYNYTCLMVASGNGHGDVVEYLLQRGHDPNAKNSYGKTALHYAACEGFLKITQKLLQYGAFNVVNEYNATYLVAASYNGHDDIVEYLLQSGHDPNAKDIAGSTALFVAASKGFLKITEKLLRYGALSIVNKDNLTCLMVATLYGHDDIVEYLLQSGHDPNAMTINRSTALHFATSRGFLKITEKLVHYGALSIVDKDNVTCLMIASDNGHDDIAEHLLQSGHDPNAKDINGSTALHYAVRKGFLKITEKLLRYGALNTVNKYNDTCLMVATHFGYDDMIEYLLQSGHDPNAKNINGATALDYAASQGFLKILEKLLHYSTLSIVKKNNDTYLMAASDNGQDDIVEYLLQSGHNPNAKDINGRTALHYAASKGFLKITKKLLNYGALTIVNKDNQTCLMVASNNGHDDIVEYLLHSGHDPNAKDIYGQTPLYYAACKGFLKITEKLLNSGAVSTTNQYNDTCLMVASHFGHDDMVDYLLQSGHDPNAKNIDGSTALRYAAYDGFFKITEKLLHYGALSIVDKDNHTCLMVASSNGHDDIVEYLLQSGHDPNDRDINGSTALRYATIKGFLKITKKLLHYGALSIVSKNNHTCLIVASYNGHDDIVEYLLQSGHDPNAKDIDGSTALRYAASKGFIKITEKLLHYGASSIVNKANQTCLMAASANGYEDMVEYLLQSGHDPNAKDTDGTTALHIAASRGFLKMADMLVHYGALMTTDDEGITPLTEAALFGRVDIVESLKRSHTRSHLCTRLEEIELLELLGARYGIGEENYDIDKCFHYLWLAMSARYSDPEEIHHKKLGPLVPAYGNRLECQNLAELEAIKDNCDALHMEVLMVLERIFGKSDPKVLDSIHGRGTLYCDDGRLSRCISLWLRALNLRQENDPYISRDLLSFTQLFSAMVNKGINIDFPLAEEVFERLLFDLGTLQACPLTMTDKTKKEALDKLNDSIMHTALYLMVILKKISHTEKQELRVCELVCRFNCLNLRLKSKQSYTPLHMACDATTTMDDDRYLKKMIEFPSEIIVNCLLKCGADVNEIDSDGNSPLHLLLATYNKPVSDSKFLHNMIMSLLEAGALANRYEKRMIYNCYRGISGSLYGGFMIGPLKEIFFKDKSTLKLLFFKDKSTAKKVFFTQFFH